MNSEMYDDMALEQIAKEKFGVYFDITHVVVRNIPVSHTSTATVFLTDKKQLYVFIHGKSKLLLADIKKIVSRMGLTAELFLPPKGHPSYFDDIGSEKFRTIFPGRSNPTENDIRYYRMLAPYNPALIQIMEIAAGEIRQFDTDASTGWRPAVKFTYRRIKTS